MYTIIVNGAPFHTAVPTPRTKAASSANSTFFLALLALNTAIKNMSESIMKEVMKPSPLYTSAAVLAMSPLDIATKNIARNARTLLLAKYLTM